MTYLLDINVLLALGLQEHEFHQRTARWVKKISLARESAFATCPITELGFLRVLLQIPAYSFTLSAGKMLLAQLKTTDGLRFIFLADGNGIADLPLWVRWPKQITDGHLVSLAKSQGAILATLDRRIPGALVIPR